MKKPAFSTIELMVTIIVVMLIMASITPSITKKLNSRSVNIGGTIGTGTSSSVEFEPDCSHINSDCELCTTTTCMLCLKICPTGQYARTSDCTYQACSDLYGDDCLTCTNKKCKKCDSDSKYINNNTCTICPIGNYCDSVNKIVCEEGKYTDTTGQTTCKDCEIGYKCTGGLKSPCEAGYYNSSTNQTTCLPCEAGYYCEGSKDKTQCPQGQYQDQTAQSSCKTCTTEGYYVSSDRTSCNICEAGYYCPGDGTKTQCPAGTYSQAGAKECIKCSAGTYSSTAGATSVSTCQSCSSKTANCTTCDVATGACATCNSGYILSGTSCVLDNPCGDLAELVVLSNCRLCMTKYNVGDGGLTMPSGVVHITSVPGSVSGWEAPYCWYGQTSGICNDDDTRYSGCYRTVCNYLAAIYLCQYLNYNGLTWSIPLVSDYRQIVNEKPEMIFGQATNSLLFCTNSTNGANSVCTVGSGKCGNCMDNDCYIHTAWTYDQVDLGDDQLNAYVINFYPDSTMFGARNGGCSSSVRCVSYL